MYSEIKNVLMSGAKIALKRIKRTSLRTGIDTWRKYTESKLRMDGNGSPFKTLTIAFHREVREIKPPFFYAIQVSKWTDKRDQAFQGN